MFKQTFIFFVAEGSHCLPYYLRADVAQWLSDWAMNQEVTSLDLVSATSQVAVFHHEFLLPFNY